MDSERFQTITEISQALWRNPERSREITRETVASVALLKLAPESALEKAALSLMKRALKDPDAAPSPQLHRGHFYRLNPKERFSLFALHRLGWNYQKLSRVVGEPLEMIAGQAWSARVKLAAFHGTLFQRPHTNALGPHCPEYQDQYPWPSRFLDEELEAKEQVFFQNHLMACHLCQKTLASARELYFSVEKEVHSIFQTQQEAPSRLKEIWNETQLYARGNDLDLKQSLILFGRRREVKWGLLVVSALILIKLLK